MDSGDREILIWIFFTVVHLGRFFQHSDQFIGYGVCGQEVLNYRVIHYTVIV